MKVKNLRTGEIGEVIQFYCSDERLGIVVRVENKIMYFSSDNVEIID